MERFIMKIIYVFLLGLILVGCDVQKQNQTQQKSNAERSVETKAKQNVESFNRVFGTVAHFSRWQYRSLDTDLHYASKNGFEVIGINMDWQTLYAPDKKTLDFKMYDNIINTAKKYNVGISVDISPHPKGDDVYLQELPKLVKHFKGRIHDWRIFGEVNAPAQWGSVFDPKRYGYLLRESCKIIRANDPSTKITCAGLAESGNPWQFLDKAFTVDTEKDFDILEIHYYPVSVPEEERYFSGVAEMKEFIKKHKLEKKTLRLGETGYNTVADNPTTSRIIEEGLKYLKINPKTARYAIIDDPSYKYRSVWTRGSLQGMINSAPEHRLTKFTFDGLKSLTAKWCQVLVLAPNQQFPSKYKDALVKYLNSGGIIVSAGGYPLGNDIIKNGDEIKIDTKLSKLPRQLHYLIGPHVAGYVSCEKVEATEGFEQIRPEGHYRFKYIDTRLLKDNDKFIPIAYGTCKDMRQPIAGILSYGSELKGHFIIVAPYFDRHSNNFTQQAKLTTRSIITCYALGFDDVFLYMLRDHIYPSVGSHYYGLLTRDYAAKPALEATRFLSCEMFPKGSSRPKLKIKNQRYIATWTRPDGKVVSAVWSPFDIGEITLSAQQKPEAVFDWLGVDANKRVSFENGKLKIKLQAGGTYFVVGQACDF